MPQVNHLFSNADRLPVPISQIALKSDITIFGTHYGDNSYYADYAGIAKKYPSDTILEIGVRFGYSGVALCKGVLEAGVKKLAYTGLDAEMFGVVSDQVEPPLDSEFRNWQRVEARPGVVRSHVLAARNFKTMFDRRKVKAEFITLNTQLQPLSDAVMAQTYGLINVDGDHSYEGALKDMTHVWPLLRPGGLMLVDDMSFAHVRPALMQFLKLRETEGYHIEWQIHPNERDLAIVRKLG